MKKENAEIEKVSRAMISAVIADLTESQQPKLNGAATTDKRESKLFQFLDAAVS